MMDQDREPTGEGSCIDPQSPPLSPTSEKKDKKKGRKKKPKKSPNQKNSIEVEESDDHSEPTKSKGKEQRSETEKESLEEAELVQDRDPDVEGIVSNFAENSMEDEYRGTEDSTENQNCEPQSVEDQLPKKKIWFEEPELENSSDGRWFDNLLKERNVADIAPATLNVENVLEELNLAKYLQHFLENEIDFEAFLLCENDDLREIGIPLGPRKKLLKFIDSYESPPSSVNINPSNNSCTDNNTQLADDDGSSNKVKTSEKKKHHGVSWDDQNNDNSNGKNRAKKKKKREKKEKARNINSLSPIEDKKLLYPPLTPQSDSGNQINSSNEDECRNNKSTNVNQHSASSQSSNSSREDDDDSTGEKDLATGNSDIVKEGILHFKSDYSQAAWNKHFFTVTKNGYLVSHPPITDNNYDSSTSNNHGNSSPKKNHVENLYPDNDNSNGSGSNGGSGVNLDLETAKYFESKSMMMYSWRIGSPQPSTHVHDFSDSLFFLETEKDVCDEWKKAILLFASSENDDGSKQIKKNKRNQGLSTNWKAAAVPPASSNKREGVVTRGSMSRSASASSISSSSSSSGGSTDADSVKKRQKWKERASTFGFSKSKTLANESAPENVKTMIEYMFEIPEEDQNFLISDFMKIDEFLPNGKAVRHSSLERVSLGNHLYIFCKNNNSKVIGRVEIHRETTVVVVSKKKHTFALVRNDRKIHFSVEDERLLLRWTLMIDDVIGQK